MPNWTPEFAFERFTHHKPTIAAADGANEATTRMRAIDTLVFDVLGWDKLLVETELYCRAEGYADYALKSEASISLIIEAKKAGETFMLPGRKLPNSPLGFPLLAKECPSAEAALRQALGYAASTGARYIAITNGYQWLLTLTFVPNQPVTERSVYVFESLAAIENKFRLFWDCFSPDGVGSNRAANALMESRKAPPPSKLSQRIPNYPVPSSRNSIVNELSAVLAAVWDEVRYDEEAESFLKECYVEPDPSETGLAQASELLQQRLGTDERIRAQALAHESVPGLLNQRTPEKPVVVLGRVGHGKTTFLRYLRTIKAREVLEKYIQIHIDFLDKPSVASDVARFVNGEIEDQLRERYGIDISEDGFVRAALHSDLSRFRRTPEARAYPSDSPEYKREELAFIKGIRNDPHAYLGKAMWHIRMGREFSVAIFLDNLDRRTEAIQEEAYLRASAIARDWSCLTFVCLRPNTFYRSKQFGVLDSVAPIVIHVASPRTEHLLVRRLRYAKKYAEGNAPVSGPRGPLSANYSFELPTVASFLDCLAESFRRNAKLTRLFEALSNGNAREVLNYVYDVLTSSHLDTRKIVEKHQESGRYIMPDHEALRAILYGDSIHFDPQRSVCINLFDIQRADPAEHFTRLLTLHHLFGVPQAHPFFGYCSVTDVVRHLCQLGFSEEHARYTIRFLFESKCCESRDPIEEWTDHIREIRGTDKGRYHLSVLAFTFQYMDAITVDTPILNDHARGAISDVQAIADRLARSRTFVDYLNSSATAVPDSAAQQLWKDVYVAVTQDIASIQASLKRKG